MFPNRLSQLVITSCALRSIIVINMINITDRLWLKTDRVHPIISTRKKLVYVKHVKHFQMCLDGWHTLVFCSILFIARCASSSLKEINHLRIAASINITSMIRDGMIYRIVWLHANFSPIYQLWSKMLWPCCPCCNVSFYPSLMYTFRNAGVQEKYVDNEEPAIDQ